MVPRSRAWEAPSFPPLGQVARLEGVDLLHLEHLNCF